jgi:hypothetical protein
MRLPRDNNSQDLTWIAAPENDALLYFVQLMDEMVSHPTLESLRAVSLDSYHRLREAERTWEEAEQAGISARLEALIDELRAYLDRDPIVKVHFSTSWSAAQSRLKSAKNRPIEAIEAVLYLASDLNLHFSYFRECRRYIINAVGRGTAKDKRDFRFVVENYCSYLSNIGYHDESIFSRVRTRFFAREVTEAPVKELHRFFSYFPYRARRQQLVAFAATQDFVEVLEYRPEFRSIGPNYPATLGVQVDSFSVNPQRYVFGWHTEALDAFDARARCESHLSAVRAIAYTAMPYAEIGWDPHFIVMEHDRRSVILREPMDVLRRGRRRILRGRAADLKARLEFFLNAIRGEDDYNRLLNAITIYASAFHSESPASQLRSLWSSLEGLLPTPPTGRGTGGRIGSFARDVVACYKRLYLVRHINALHHDLFSTYRDSYTGILDRTTTQRLDNVTKLASIFCRTENEVLQREMGVICARNPLARQRLFELYAAGKKAGSLYKLVSDSAEKSEWQLYRIYRERNRIVHRASPSSNLETLIQTLNAYILIVFDAMISAGGAAEPAAKIDDLFAFIRITEEARAHEVAAIANEPMDGERLELVLGKNIDIAVIRRT